MIELGNTMMVLGFVGLIGFGIMWLVRENGIAERKKWLEHGQMSIDRRMAELKKEDLYGYVARNCHYKLHEQKSVYNAATKSSQKESAVFYGFYGVLVEINKENIVVWRTQDFQSFKGYISKYPLYKIPCHASAQIPLKSVGKLEIAPFSESDHRATSDSFYIYTVVDGKTYVLGQDTTLADVREMKEKIQGYIDELKGIAIPKATKAADFDDGIPT